MKAHQSVFSEKLICWSGVRGGADDGGASHGTLEEWRVKEQSSTRFKNNEAEEKNHLQSHAEKKNHKENRHPELNTASGNEESHLEEDRCRNGKSRDNPEVLIL